MNILSKIPHSRLLLYLVLLGIFFPLFSVGYFYFQSQKIKDVRMLLYDTQNLVSLREKKQASNVTVQNHFHGNDRFYIDKHLESIILRQSEIESLEKIASQQQMIDNEAVKSRLDHLKNSNKLVFSEGVVQAYPFFQETMETLIHPVEINNSDLQNILAKIEGIEVGPFAPGPDRPQLIITECKLERKKIWETSEEFILNLKLLKREYL